MSIERIISAILADTKIITKDDMGDEVTTHRAFKLAVVTAADRFVGHYQMNRQINGSITLSNGDNHMYIENTHVIGVQPVWL